MSKDEELEVEAPKDGRGDEARLQAEEVEEAREHADYWVCPVCLRWNEQLGKCKRCGYVRKRSVNNGGYSAVKFQHSFLSLLLYCGVRNWD